MSEAVPPGRAIDSRGLTKKFGSIHALSGIDLSVAGSESVALFGPNGAGKTTLIRILSLGLKATAGSIRIGGLDPRKDDLCIRGQIGVISHHSFLYDDLSARENLEYFARMYGVPDPGGRANELLDSVGLALRADDPVRTFSRGMQQRVSLVRALVHDPAILFLDEPFTGLDPQAAIVLRRTLERLRRERRTLLMVTHNLGQGLELSDRWLILARGRIVGGGRSSETDRTEFESLYFERVSEATAA